MTNNTAQGTAQLTAGAYDIPATHDGSTEFTFELRFSETQGKRFSNETLRGHAFAVADGEDSEARRLEKFKNVRWEITVRPDSSGAVNIVLPAITDYTAGAPFAPMTAGPCPTAWRSPCRGRTDDRPSVRKVTTNP